MPLKWRPVEPPRLRPPPPDALHLTRIEWHGLEGYLCLDAEGFEAMGRNWLSTLRYIDQQNAVVEFLSQ